LIFFFWEKRKEKLLIRWFEHLQLKEGKTFLIGDNFRNNLFSLVFFAEKSQDK